MKDRFLIKAHLVGGEVVELHGVDSNDEALALATEIISLGFFKSDDEARVVTVYPAHSVVKVVLVWNGDRDSFIKTWLSTVRKDGNPTVSFNHAT